MNPSARNRLLVLTGIGVALVALVWLVNRPAQRGVEYYFLPTWVGPRGLSSDQELRHEELTNISRSLPLVQAALERPESALGLKWEQVKEQLPDYLQKRVPTYIGPIYGIPLRWISAHVGDPEVARFVVSNWSRWSRAVQGEWLWLQESKELTHRWEYVPLLRAVAHGTDGLMALKAAQLLAAYRPLDSSNAVAIARSLAGQGNAPRLDWVRVQLLQSLLVDQESLPPPITQVLEDWLTRPGSFDAPLAALTLGCVEPARFPPGSLLESRLLALPKSGQTDFLPLLAMPEFRPMGTSSWSVGFLQNLLTNPVAGTRPDLRLELATLKVLEELGSPAAVSIPAILPWLSHTNLEAARTASRAFASVALGSPEWVPAILPHLTNQNLAPPLLLWLTALGPKAADAREIVAEIAADRIRLQESPHSIPRMDPILARRYGLIPRDSPGGRGSTKPDAAPIVRKPSRIPVSAHTVCPKHLAPYWPGYSSAREAVLKQAPRATEREYFQKLSEKLGTIYLDHLARHCLTNLSGGTLP